MNDRRAKQATPHAELIAEIMDSRVPKNDREHAAGREIERLTGDLVEARIALANAECRELCAKDDRDRLRGLLTEARLRLVEAERDFVAICSLHAHANLAARLAEAERALADKGSAGESK